MVLNLVSNNVFKAVIALIRSEADLFLSVWRAWRKVAALASLSSDVAAGISLAEFVCLALSSIIPSFTLVLDLVDIVFACTVSRRQDLLAQKMLEGRNF